MNKKDIEIIERIAEELDVKVMEYENDFDFEYYTNFGQDFCFTISKTDNLIDFAQEVYNYWQAYDIDEETALWIGDDGHGKNGAPYHISDILKDMQECENLLEKFWTSLNFACSDDFVAELQKRREIEADVVVKLEDFIGSQYARTIESAEIAKDGSPFLDKVVDDVMETSAARTDGEYNDDDIKLAIGRTILRLLNIN